MKVLVTGANGLLGSSICELLTARHFEVYKLNRRDFSWDCNDKNVELLRKFDIVIHAAANTNVEECELDPDSCYRDNTLLTELLSFAASQAGCKFIYISSTGIYGCSKEDTPYTEYDSIKPTTHHHNSKWLAEQAVLSYCKSALVIRAGWLFGGSPKNKKNFVARRLEEALISTNRKIFSNSSQRGVPTFVDDFSETLYQMIIRNEFGVFNLVNEGRASRYEYVKAIIDIAQIDVEVIPVSSTTFNRHAAVSNNEMAFSLKLRHLGYQPLPLWSDSLRTYITRDLLEWIEIEKRK